jgi:hypothetical protein
MYDPASIQAELAVQLRGPGTPGDLANRTSFREFVVNVQEFRVYLAMLGNQTHVSMIHTPGVYYSLASAWPSQICSLISSEIRGRRSHHTTY